MVERHVKEDRVSKSVGKSGAKEIRCDRKMGIYSHTASYLVGKRRFFVLKRETNFFTASQFEFNASALFKMQLLSILLLRQCAHLFRVIG